jgi:hypothetical protein
MADAGYTYVENLTWVLLGANHNVLRLPSPLSCQSHLSLYIFRREGERPCSLDYWAVPTGQSGLQLWLYAAHMQALSVSRTFEAELIKAVCTGLLSILAHDWFQKVFLCLPLRV